jgi:hypothetical protein
VLKQVAQALSASVLKLGCLTVRYRKKTKTNQVVATSELSILARSRLPDVAHYNLNNQTTHMAQAHNELASIFDKSSRRSCYGCGVARSRDCANPRHPAQDWQAAPSLTVVVASYHMSLGGPEHDRASPN